MLKEIKERRDQSMAYEVKNLLNNDDIEQLDQNGCMRVIQYKRDLSILPWTAEMAYYASKMGCHKRQILCQLNQRPGVIVQNGMMQWMLGEITVATDVNILTYHIAYEPHLSVSKFLYQFSCYQLKKI